MNCEGCDKIVAPSLGYYIVVKERGGFSAWFCSWYCASSIINEKADEEREAEKAQAES